MAYQENKPQSTDTISTSQADLLGNFQAIKTLIDINHSTFGSATEGKHPIIHFPAVTVTPGSIPAATTATEYALYSTSTGFFIRPPSQSAGTVSSDINLVSTSGSVVPGWYKFPNGLIMKWGQSSTAIARNTLGDATLVSGAGIPNITTLLCAQITADATDHECVFSYNSFDDTTLHKVYAYNYRQFAGSGTTFRYLLIGV